MSVQPRIKNIEKRLSFKLNQIEPQSKWKFPIRYSTEKPESYFLTKWQDGKFVEIETTVEEVDAYNRDCEGISIFVPTKKVG